MGAAVDDDGIAEAQACVDELLAEHVDLFVVAGGADEDAGGVDELADGDDAADRGEVAGSDDDESLGEEHVAPVPSAAGSTSGPMATRMRLPPTMTSPVSPSADRAMRVPQLFGGSVRRRASSLIRPSSSRAVRRVFDSASFRLPAL